ncbi:MAG: hypothetical protein EHM33_05435 [Chloroflexi bacterium]|nr:MAG: hypothetical protein EHM33_05435 [Chloroflexota bacterium]
MNWRHYAILFVIGLVVPFAVSRFQSLPGYMDADYYFAGGIQLANGQGFTEPYLWNYLDDPAGLPHPSHTYWMPLASIVSAFGMWITGQSTYAAGRFPFILLSACVPLLTAALAFRVSRQTRLAVVSGLLSIFSLYYAPFMPVPDNYALFMLLGTAFLLLAPFRQRWIPIALGALAGLMTLARSDGLLWLGLAGLTVIWKSSYSYKEAGVKNSFKQWLGLIIPAGLLVILGYLLTIGFWHVRNINLFGSLLTPGGGRLLWLQNYNQTFIYPPESLTRASFLQAGWDLALQNRVRAFSANFSNAFGAQGGIFLFPFILIGLWQLRHELRTKIAVTGWLILFVVMTVIFPFAGSRGSFFHAGAAFQPYWWVAAPIGLDAVLAWLRSHGQFRDKNAPYFLQGVLVLLAIFMTVYLVNFRVIASGWAKDDFIYPAVEKMFLDNGIQPGDVVIVRNPPGYFIASGRPSISLPFGDESTIKAVAEKYNARYLVIEKDGTFDSIQDLYDDPQSNTAFVYIGEVNEAKLYRVELAH